MLKPPFKFAKPEFAAGSDPEGVARYLPTACCEPEPAADPVAPTGRIRLADLDRHLHCSVIGTCLGTTELRKLMGRFLFVRDASDLDVHNDAVLCAGQGGPVAKALHKALDQRHDAVLRRFARARSPGELTLLWEEALRQGEIPGGYWAVLTHRDANEALRNKAFGDVHMLSHLVGAANRADIRRLVVLERDNEQLRERAERQQARAHELVDERERLVADLRTELALAKADAQDAHARVSAIDAVPGAADLAAALAATALQTERRARAERAAAAAEEEASRLRLELAHMATHLQVLNREVAAAETQLREIGASSDASGRALAHQLHGQRIFYVGGRPSSTPSIRDTVLRHGGEFQQHDGGLEDRKGLLSAGVSWAHLVVFPVDCIDHDSAGNLKRLCARQGVVYVPLRSASVASFAAALMNSPPDERPPGGLGCHKHA